MLRWLKWPIILGILIGGTVAATGPIVEWWNRRNAPKFTTATVTRGRVESVVNSTGTVKPVRSVSIGAFVSGPISEIFVDFNSVVKKGDLLARIDPQLPAAAVERDRATLMTQRAELARIDALLQQAKNNEERARKLLAVNKDYLSDTEMDQYHFTRLTFEAQRKLAEASIAQAEASLKNSEANLGYTEIRSPVDGVVIERKVDPGQTVAASFQTPEMFVLAPDMDQHMNVFASVDEADIGLIHAAQAQARPVTFTVDAYPQDLFTGRIDQIRKSSTTNQNVVTYPVVIQAPNPDLKLMPGMTANITFLIEARDAVLRIPSAAMRYVPEARFVRPEDRHHVEGDTGGLSNKDAAAMRLSASERVDSIKKRQRRVVWVKDGEFLRAITVVLGIIESQYAELVEGDIAEGQELVTGVNTNRDG